MKITVLKFEPKTQGASSTPVKTDDMFHRWLVMTDAVGPCVFIGTDDGVQVARPGDFVLLAEHEGVEYVSVLGRNPNLFLDDPDATICTSLSMPCCSKTPETNEPPSEPEREVIEKIAQLPKVQP